MPIVPRYPPRKSCGLEPGTRVRVVREFAALEHTFVCGEELIFIREMFDRDVGCDLWIFGTEESRQIEDSLPDDGLVDDRDLLSELVAHKHIYGMHGLEKPSSWLSNFEVVDDGPAVETGSAPGV